MAKRHHRKGKSTAAPRSRRYDAGTRLVALFEAAKGAVVILAGLGLLTLIHHNVQHVAEEVVRHLHFNPASRVPQIFTEASARATDARLWVLAITAIFYSLVRFVEAYGLWRRQSWAEWLGILSGGIYLPLELYELGVKVTPVKVVLFLINLLIVGWLCWVRWKATSRG